jgi:hypothetical protein
VDALLGRSSGCASQPGSSPPTVKPPRLVPKRWRGVLACVVDDIRDIGLGQCEIILQADFREMFAPWPFLKTGCVEVWVCASVVYVCDGQPVPNQTTAHTAIDRKRREFAFCPCPFLSCFERHV